MADESYNFSGNEGTVTIGGAPAGVGGARIVGVGGYFGGKSFPLAVGQTLTLGRDEKTSDIVFSLSTNAISRTHCTIAFSGSSFAVTDNSSNGTFYAAPIPGSAPPVYSEWVRLTRGVPQQLAPGTKLRLATGGECFLLEAAHAAAPATVHGGDDGGTVIVNRPPAGGRGADGAQNPSGKKLLDWGDRPFTSAKDARRHIAPRAGTVLRVILYLWTFAELVMIIVGLAGMLFAFAIVAFTFEFLLLVAMSYKSNYWYIQPLKNSLKRLETSESLYLLEPLRENRFSQAIAGAVFLTEHLIFIRYVLLLRYEEIAWVYVNSTTTKSTALFITLGSSTAKTVMIYDIFGRCHEVKQTLTDEEAERLTATILSHNPKILLGYSRDRLKKYEQMVKDHKSGGRA